jgi:hypothetical protein
MVNEVECNASAAVAGSVVYQQELPVWVILLEDAMDGFVEKWLRVEKDDDDGYERRQVHDQLSAAMMKNWVAGEPEPLDRSPAALREGYLG